METEPTIISFSYPVRVYRATFDQTPIPVVCQQWSDVLQQLAKDITQTVQCQVLWEREVKYTATNEYVEFLYGFVLVGALSQLNAVRASFLRHSPSQVLE
jgi:hypothetical protein